MYSLVEKIFTISSEQDFNDLSVEIFQLQYRHNPLYRKFVDFLQKKPESVLHYHDIPFLPVEMFRNHKIIPEGFNHEHYFISSGTTGSGVRSRHYVHSLKLYERSFMKSFGYFYGDPADYNMLALLPSYMENKRSSLIYMVDKLMRLGRKKNSGFYLQAGDALYDLLNDSNNKGKTLLWGVSYALLDFAEKYNLRNENLTIIETGGMKGRREEMVRIELHERLCSSFNLDHVHSEYGMTELLSQAYSKGNGQFFTPPWMKVLIRDINDPLSFEPLEKTGGICIIDLANIFSCPFIATKDIGKIRKDGSFEVLGRYDNSDVRGCNLLVH